MPQTITLSTTKKTTQIPAKTTFTYDYEILVSLSVVSTRRCDIKSYIVTKIL